MCAALEVALIGREEGKLGLKALFTENCYPNCIARSVAGGGKGTESRVAQETDSGTRDVSMWLTRCSTIAMKGNHALRALMLNLTECFYTFLLTCASLPLSLFLNLQWSSRRILLLNQQRE